MFWVEFPCRQKTFIELTIYGFLVINVEIREVGYFAVHQGSYMYIIHIRNFCLQRYDFFLGLLVSYIAKLHCIAFLRKLREVENG